MAMDRFKREEFVEEDNSKKRLIFFTVVFIFGFLLFFFTKDEDKYSEKEITLVTLKDNKVDKEKLYVIVPENEVAKHNGLRVFEKSPSGKYDGMLFYVPENTSFTTTKMQSYVKICSLEETLTDNEFIVLKCECLPPNVDQYFPQSTVVLEFLSKDPECKTSLKF